MLLGDVQRRRLGNIGLKEENYEVCSWLFYLYTQHTCIILNSEVGISITLANISIIL